MEGRLRYDMFAGGGEGGQMKSNDTPTDSAGDNASKAVKPDRQDPKPARFDFAAANLAHLRSQRGRNAGPMKKAPPRR